MLREFEADFAVGTVQDASFAVRPDAIATLVPLSFGPIALGDTSKGLLAKGWYARADNDAGKVYLAAAADDPTFGWRSEVELFSYAGDPIDEIDLTPDQNGNFVVVAERAGHVWIYYYKPASYAFVFEDFGVGRNPRCTLDDPAHPAYSDIVVFYGSGGAIMLRQQGDLYASETDTGESLDADHYIEGVIRDQSHRIHLIISARDSGTGQWTLERLSSLLYPLYLDAEGVGLTHVSINGQLYLLVVATDAGFEGVGVGHTTVSGVLYDTSIKYDAGVEPLAVAHASVSGVLFDTVIRYNNATPDELALAHGSVSGSIELLVIEFDATRDDISLAHTSISGNVEPPFHRTSSSGLLYAQGAGSPSDFDVTIGTLTDNGDGTWSWDFGNGGGWCVLKSSVMSNLADAMVFGEMRRPDRYYMGMVVRADSLSPLNLVYLFSDEYNNGWGLYHYKSGANNRINLSSGGGGWVADEWQAMSLVATGGSVKGLMFTNSSRSKNSVSGSVSTTEHPDGRAGFLANNNGTGMTTDLRNFMVFASRYLTVEGLTSGMVVKLEDATDTELKSGTATGASLSIDCADVDVTLLDHVSVYGSDGTTLVEAGASQAWPGETWSL